MNRGFRCVRDVLSLGQYPVSLIFGNSHMPQCVGYSVQVQVQASLA